MKTDAYIFVGYMTSSNDIISFKILSDVRLKKEVNMFDIWSISNHITPFEIKLSCEVCCVNNLRFVFAYMT